MHIKQPKTTEEKNSELLIEHVILLIYFKNKVC